MSSAHTLHSMLKEVESSYFVTIPKQWIPHYKLRFQVTNPENVLIHTVIVEGSPNNIGNELIDMDDQIYYAINKWKLSRGYGDNYAVSILEAEFSIKKVI